MNLSLPTRRIVKPRRRHPRGSAYLAVLGASTIVMIIGLAALMAVRVEQQISTDADEAVQARFNARSSIEAALFFTDAVPTWRDIFPNDTWLMLFFDDGTIAFKFDDEIDGVLSGDATQPVRLYGKGTVGDAVRIQSVLLQPPDLTPLPMDFLSVGIHSSLELKITGGNTLTVTGAPASTNANLRHDGDIIGDAEALTESGGGTVTGMTTVPAPFKNLPSATVIDSYIAKATLLAFNGDFDKIVLAPGVNQYGGGLNPDGVYYINTGDNDIVIKNSRIYGTLVINAGTKEVKIQGDVLIHPYRADYPVLIVRGKLRIEFDGYDSQLDEVDMGHNFNPPGAPYQGQTDNIDDDDVYPSEIQGLVHVTGQLELKTTSMIRGAIVAENLATIGDDPQIVHDANLVTSPPQGYMETPGNTGMSKAPGTWKWETQ